MFLPFILNPIDIQLCLYYWMNTRHCSGTEKHIDLDHVLMEPGWILLLPFLPGVFTKTLAPKMVWCPVDFEILLHRKVHVLPLKTNIYFVKLTTQQTKKKVFIQLSNNYP